MKLRFIYRKFEKRSKDVCAVRKAINALDVAMSQLKEETKKELVSAYAHLSMRLIDLLRASGGISFIIRASGGIEVRFE